VLWEPSFPDAVAKANKYFVACDYHDASVEYLVAASVAPTKDSEQFMLEQAWVAHERSEGRPDPVFEH
jgi:hypothetical protein